MNEELNNENVKSVPQEREPWTAPQATFIMVVSDTKHAFSTEDEGNDGFYHCAS